MKITYLKNIPIDKQGHFIVGGGIAAGSSALLAIAGISTWWALIPVAIAAVGKEIYDYYHPTMHTADVFDAAATLSGGFAVCSLIALALLII